MEEKRKNEIAYKMLKVYIAGNVKLSDIGKSRRELGNMAKEFGIDLNEIVEFAEIMFRDIVEEKMTELKKTLK